MTTAKTVSEPCCICGSNRPCLLFEKAHVPYWRCGACGFVFSRPDANANLPSSIDAYEPAYMTYLDAGPDDDANMADLVRWASGHVRLGGMRVLDVGCGSGKLVRYLRRNSVDAWGVEASAPLFGKFLAQDTFFHNTSIEEFAGRRAAGTFGAAFACDVIEHVERPDLFLRSIADVLDPGGMVFLSTPDVQSLFARVCGRHWHFYNKYHLSFLCHTTVDLLAAKCGLRRVAYAHIPRVRTAGYLVQYVADFILGRGALRPPRVLYRISVPVNVRDVMHVVLKKA